MPADAGAASGLLNTSRQVGGAAGRRVNTTAASFALDTSGGLRSELALAHGHRVALILLATLALAGAVLVSTLLAPSPALAEDAVTASGAVLEAA